MKKLRSFLWACIAAASLFPVIVSAQQQQPSEAMDIRYLHTMLGVLDTEDAWTVSDDTGEISTDMDKLVYGGGVAQMSSVVGKFQYGFESGGLVSFKNDTSFFIRSDSNGGTAKIKVDNQLWMLDISLGCFVSYRPWYGVRVYASAGPSIMIGSMSIDEDDVEVQEGDEEDINFKSTSRENDIDVGLYGRVGVDIVLNNGFIVGLSARKVDSEMDFGDSGIIEFDDVQYFLTLGKAF